MSLAFESATELSRRLSTACYNLRPGTAQSTESHRKRLSQANEARMNPGSSDIISNLLASFDDISTPSDDTFVHPALRNAGSPEISFGGSSLHSITSATDLRGFRNSPIHPSSKRSSGTYSLTWGSEAAVADAVERASARAPSFSTAAFSNTDGAGLFSRNKSPLATEAYINVVTGTNGETDWTQGLMQADDQLSPLPTEMVGYTGYYSPTAQNFSGESSRYCAEDGYLTITNSRGAQGKQRLGNIPILRPPRKSSYDCHQNGRVLSTSAPPPRVSSRKSSFAQPIKQDPKNAFDSSAQHNKDRSFLDAGNRMVRGIGDEKGRVVEAFDCAMPVPDRKSSLKRVDSLTLLRRRSSVQSVTPSLNGQSAINLPISGPGPEIAKRNSENEEDDSDVLKRIQVIKAATMERRKSLGNQPLPQIQTNGSVLTSLPVIPSPPSPPDTTVSSQQVTESLHVTQRRISIGAEQFHRISADTGISEHSFAASSALSSVTNADIVPVEFVNLSRNKAAMIRGASPLNQRIDSTSQQQIQPAPRPQSRLRRWSQASGDLFAGDKDFGHKPSPLAKALLIQERRPSTESMHESISSFLQGPRLSQKLRIPNERRTIAFSEVGDPSGEVVICCVGMGMTRYVMAFYDELATSLKIRLITPDRPGIGGSEPYTDGVKKPIFWPDDVQAICNYLKIDHFSLLAHSAGAIYALATAMRMPNHIRGQIHLLAPWIPPSQLTLTADASSINFSSAGSFPRSQRFLRMLPTPFLKLSSSSWGLNGAFSRNKIATTKSKWSMGSVRTSTDTRPSNTASPRMSFGQMRSAFSSPVNRSNAPSADALATPIVDQHFSPIPSLAVLPETGRPSIEAARKLQRRYDAALTPAIWELATRNANPAIDLLVCLERNQSIGFRYADVDLTQGEGGRGKGVVIHHGSKDTRVPIENVKWLGRIMKGAEVRVVEGEGHGLMASAGVMGNVLTEMGREIEGLSE